MANRSPHVFSIPASAPFLPTLVEALRSGGLIDGFRPAADPLALASATLYLPTRRACRQARDVLLDGFGLEAAILPRIVPIGDVDEDALIFADAAGPETAAQTLDLPPALGELERRVLLAQLIRAWAANEGMRAAGNAPLVASTAAAALGLAADLGRLIDDLLTREVPFDRLDGLVPDEFDEYWQKTLLFLQVARVAWPKILAERGAIEAAERRDALIAAEGDRLERNPSGPVIAAGSTGSMPATARLLSRIAALPQGAVVLPGLDTDLDETSWALIGADPPAYAHPQFALYGLLKQIGIARDAVTILGAPSAYGRERLVSEALRPAAATELWHDRLADDDFNAHADGAMSSVTVIEAASAEDEALAIALVLRECLETPDKTAALVTPDRVLARRVIAALSRWRIAIDDSGGDALGETPAGIFARLAARAALEGLEPVTLLALLKHPLLRLGGAAGHWREAIAALELAVLRGPRPRAGTAGLKQAIEAFPAERDGLHRSDMRRQISDAAVASAIQLVDALAAALAPFEDVRVQTLPLGEWAALHRAAVAALANEAGDDVESAVAFSGHDGAALSRYFDDLIEHGGRFAVGATDYLDVFDRLAAERSVRRPATSEPRIRIFGPLESRLQSVDVMVLGGLVENTWPPEAETDAWLNRPMRHALGLDLPERRIGLSAHDFAQALGAPRAVLTRAAKVSGSPTVMSRFMQRLQAAAGVERWARACALGARTLSLVRDIDKVTEIKIAAPMPKPPLDVRPKRLSVTDIENWLRDPYTIYARHILRLQPLDAVDTPPGARDRGSVVHEAVQTFTERYANALPADPEAALIAIGEEAFRGLENFPEARTFWWPRFRRVAHWLSEWERERRATLSALHAEVSGHTDIPFAGGLFRLSARADRIERRADGRYAVLDYKTGQIKTAKEVAAGFGPQLTLEAAILRRGGFKNLPAGDVGELSYVRIHGGDPAGECKPLDFKDSDPDSEAETAFLRLTELITAFADPEQPYRSLVHPKFRTRYGDYDHLARVKEWSRTGGAVDGGEGA
ncbi:MAG TPA: double-strand break repair protein AddB [Xanthobacteraceae bacterium]|jgi:ATP-dependent helicase/nuclease subunit B|nr:double-strand break repair protein AddB [Xanthobacteraceae bacterium]